MPILRRPQHGREGIVSGRGTAPPHHGFYYGGRSDPFGERGRGVPGGADHGDHGGQLPPAGVPCLCADQRHFCQRRHGGDERGAQRAHPYHPPGAGGGGESAFPPDRVRGSGHHRCGRDPAGSGQVHPFSEGLGADCGGHGRRVLLCADFWRRPESRACRRCGRCCGQRLPAVLRAARRGGRVPNHLHRRPHHPMLYFGLQPAGH